MVWRGGESDTRRPRGGVSRLNGSVMMARSLYERPIMTDINMQRRDRKHYEWEMVCAEVTHAVKLVKKLEERVTWLVAYVRGSLPPDPTQDQQYGPCVG